jgi:hypothetical protein
MFKATVILCTHRPNPAPLAETFAALAKQTLPLDAWELVLIGDAETRRIVEQVGAGWHPHVRFLEQPPQGIARARLRAMREFLEGRTDVMLFVDDDNVLAPDYLATGLAIGDREPQLGCWGGQLVGRFATPPPDWIEPFLKYLAVFPLERELRLKDSFDGNYDRVPPTAGMFLRRELATHHLRKLETKPAHLALGGTRGVPIGGEDMDLGLSVLEIGREAARFPQLTVTHLISADRLTEDYIAKLIQSVRAGAVLLEHLRGGGRKPRSKFALWRDRWRARRLPERHRRFMEAEIKGELQAREFIATLPR